MSPITPLLLRLPWVSGTLISAALAAGVAYFHSPTGSLLLDAGACEQDVASTEPEAPRSRILALQLEVESADSGCMYYSSFDVGPVEIGSEEPGRTLRRRFSFMDGCEWESVEYLVRLGEGRFAYTYTEHALSCAPGRVASGACTRSGFAVERDDEDDHAEDSDAASAQCGQGKYTEACPVMVR